MALQGQGVFPLTSSFSPKVLTYHSYFWAYLTDCRVPLFKNRTFLHSLFVFWGHQISMQGMGTKNNKSRYLCSVFSVPGVQTYMCFSNIAQFIFPKALGSRHHHVHSVDDETEALREEFVQVHNK